MWLSLWSGKLSQSRCCKTEQPQSLKSLVKKSWACRTRWKKCHEATDVGASYLSNLFRLCSQCSRTAFLLGLCGRVHGENPKTNRGPQKNSRSGAGCAVVSRGRRRRSGRITQSHVSAGVTKGRCRRSASEGIRFWGGWRSGLSLVRVDVGTRARIPDVDF